MPTYRAKIVSFNAGTHAATVRLDGSAPQVLADVPTNRGIPSAEMTAGRKVLVDTGDHHHPADFVVTTVYT